MIALFIFNGAWHHRHLHLILKMMKSVIATNPLVIVILTLDIAIFQGDFNPKK